MKKPVCFVISPIGEDGSQTRADADNVFDLIIEPALEKYQFRVVRADKISRPGAITAEMIEYIQNADLCIADLSGNNPNVMYEVGRRHETGKPCIEIARKGEELPFDLAGYRTFFYGMDTARETRDFVLTLQRVVDDMYEAGFETENPTQSIASLAHVLQRIERKIDAVQAGTAQRARPSTPTSPAAADLIRKHGIVTAINYALSVRDVDLLDELLPKANRSNRQNYVVGGLAQSATIGSRVGLELLFEEINDLSEFSIEDRKSIIGGFVTGLYRFDREKEGLELLEPFFKELYNDGPTNEYDAADTAFFLNQWQRLLHGDGQVDLSVKVGARVLALEPNEPSYLYNQAINLRNAERIDEAVTLLDSLMESVRASEEPDDDHLVFAVKLYRRTGAIEKSNEALMLLDRYHPLIAEIVRDDLD